MSGALLAVTIGLVHSGVTGASWELYSMITPMGLSRRFDELRATGTAYSAEQFTFFPLAVMAFTGVIAGFIPPKSLRAAWVCGICGASGVFVAAATALGINIDWASQGHPYSNYLRGYAYPSYALPIIWMGIFCLVSAAVLVVLLSTFPSRQIAATGSRPKKVTSKR